MPGSGHSTIEWVCQWSKGQSTAPSQGQPAAVQNDCPRDFEGRVTEPFSLHLRSLWGCLGLPIGMDRGEDLSTPQVQGRVFSCICLHAN